MAGVKVCFVSGAVLCACFPSASYVPWCARVSEIEGENEGAWKPLHQGLYYFVLLSQSTKKSGLPFHITNSSEATVSTKRPQTERGHCRATTIRLSKRMVPRIPLSHWAVASADSELAPKLASVSVNSLLVPRGRISVRHRPGAVTILRRQLNASSQQTHCRKQDIIDEKEIEWNVFLFATPH